jgi:hypothetical protein
MMNGTTSVTATARSWLLPATIAALAYPIEGVLLALPTQFAPSHAAVVAWRLTAWLACAVTFAIHVGYEHGRLQSPPVRGALHCALAVAAGGFLLAVWIMARPAWDAHAHSSRFAPLALVAFPLVTGIPAFIVGLATLALLRRLPPRNAGPGT